MSAFLPHPLPWKTLHRIAAPALSATLIACCMLASSVTFALGDAAGTADALTDFDAYFWQWRASEQPFTSDDIPRIERPAGFVVDWSPKTITTRQQELLAFEQQWETLKPPADAPLHAQVNYRLLGSALARVHWELAIEKGWQRNPQFYVDQTLGSVYVLLLPPAPFSAARQQEIVDRIQRIPATLEAAHINLTDMRQPFLQLAVDALDHVSERMDTTVTALAPFLSTDHQEALKVAAPAAIRALVEYRAWLLAHLSKARKDTAIGRENYLYFLRNVALIDSTPEALLTRSHQEWSRTVAFEAYQQARLADTVPAPIFASADAQIAAEHDDEEKIRTFLTQQSILTVPPAMQHYRNLLLPAYLAPFEDLGVTDDLTGPSRLHEDGTSYIRTPSPNLGFFNLSTARDPRPILVHEGVPGHYFQLCLGWMNPDPVRRHYYDSGANEGIGFYAEEMMLQAGLFDDNPQTRATIYSFMRLRALRVEVDVKLALGQFTLQQAADYLEHTVPMDRKTALEEAALFSSTPGQAISYQTGKLQITELLADARSHMGDKFSILQFNDFVWNNGNVPIALLRWEMLGDASQLPSQIKDEKSGQGSGH